MYTVSLMPKTEIYKSVLTYYTVKHLLITRYIQGYIDKRDYRYFRVSIICMCLYSLNQYV